MNGTLYITTESGRLMAFDTGTSQLRVLYDDPLREVLFGIACHGERMFLSGATGLTAGRITPRGFELVTTDVPFPPPMRGEGRRLMRWLWSRVEAHSRVIPYDKPGLHQMNLYQDRLYIASTVWNEIWIVDFGLHVLKRIALQPHRRDFYHLNNVFCDGAAFYVCLNRYDGRHGIGGYAKFDLAWNEIERRAVGWHSHALSIIDGRTVQLCCLDPATDTQGRYPRRAGLLVNHDLVFEYDARQYFLKDFSMNNDRIFIVGGSTTERTNRASSTGVLFVLTRDYELVEECVFHGTGGFNGCRLMGIDYSKGVEPNLQKAGASVVASNLSDGTMGAFALWFTGLPGSGKSTLAQAVRIVLKEQHGIACGFLDGDTTRATLSRDLGFSREDRIANTPRIGMQAHLLVKQDIPTLVASIAPHREARLHVRKLVEATGGAGSFVEIFVNCPVDVYMARDPKGLYARASAGLLTGLSGVDDLYEIPEQPDVHLRTDLVSIPESVQQVLECLATRGLTNSLSRAVNS